MGGFNAASRSLDSRSRRATRVSVAAEHVSLANCLRDSSLCRSIVLDIEVHRSDAIREPRRSQPSAPCLPWTAGSADWL